MTTDPNRWPVRDPNRWILFGLVVALGAIWLLFLAFFVGITK
jgi:hypothetical protein